MSSVSATIMALNTNLLKSVNILNRVNASLKSETREQLDTYQLTTIRDYLVKALKFIDPNLGVGKIPTIIMGNSIESITNILENRSIIGLTAEQKKQLTNSIQEAITEFKVAVGVYLTDHEFNYSPNQDTLLRDIVDTCLENKYYFGL